MDDTIRQYIDRALEVSRTGDHKITTEELTEIAREIGLTDADLARVDRAVEDGLARGNNYLRQQMWDDAIRELEAVAGLAPTNVDATVALAEGYVERYAASSNEHDNAAARALLKEVLDRDPNNQQAYELLNRLTRPLQKRSSTRSRLLVVGILAAAIMALIVVLTTAFLFISTSSDSPVIENRPASTTQAKKATADQPGDFGVSFVEAEGLAWELRHAEHKHYPSNSYIKIWGTVEVTGSIEVDELAAVVTITDANGAVLRKTDKTLVSTFDPMLRPRDKVRFALLVSGAPAGVHAKVEVASFRSTPSGGAYAAPKPVKLTWKTPPPPAHVSLEVFERHSGFTNPAGRRYFKGVWEFHNTGTGALRQLAYNVHLLNERGERTQSQKQFITITTSPPMLAGDIDIDSTTLEAAEGDVGYEIEVEEFK